jgi:hypothetical protein
MLHAAMYCMGNKYDVLGLSSFACGCLGTGFRLPVTTAPVKFLMENTPASDDGIRTLPNQIWRNMDMFGMRKEVNMILEMYPELRKCVLEAEYGPGC